MQKKSIKPWVILLALPMPLLMVIGVISFAMVFASRGSSAIGNNAIVELVMMLIGVVAALMILGFPIWLIMLIRTMKHNNSIDEQAEGKPPAPLDVANRQ